MTTFLLFIFGLWGSRYFLKYLFGTHQVDSASRTGRQNSCSNTDKGNSNTSSSAGKAVPFVLKESNKIHSAKTVDKTKSIARKVPQHYNDFGNSVGYVFASELSLLKLSPSQTTIRSGETIQFKLTRLDSFDNQIEIRDGISWSATGGEIDSKGLFSIDSIDKALVTITAKVNEIEATAKVNIENIYELIEPPQLKYLKVVPDYIYLQTEEEQIFEALGYDRYKNQIDCGEITWSATGGKIDQNGKLTVNNNAKGIYQVTATSKDTAKYGTTAKATLLTLGVSTRILSWAIANEELFYEFIAPLLDSESNNASLSETDALVQEWQLEIGRRIIAKLLKKASNLSFKQAFSKISDSVYYTVLPELRKIEFVDPPNNLKSGDLVQFNVIGLDQARDRINVGNQIIWNATSGTINSQGILIANSNADSVEITAKVKDKNIETKYKIKIESKSTNKDTFEFKRQEKQLNIKKINAFYFDRKDEKTANVFDESIRREQDIRGIAQSSTIKSQSNSSDDLSSNTSTDSSRENNPSITTTTAVAIRDDLSESQPPCSFYISRNHESLSIPSWFYRSQAFYDGFSAGDLSYDEYLEYMASQDCYSYFK